MYFLPSFLAHYRRLGVARFVLLDDASEDGSREYLLSQPDVTLVVSGRRFGDRVERPRRDAIRDYRMDHVWRTCLMARYGSSGWTLLVDMDEFLMLPDGMDVTDLATRLDARGARLAWAVMLDLYPRSVEDIFSGAGESDLRQSGPWYFDGVPHLRPLRFGPPRHVYGGCKARLKERYFGRARRSPMQRLADRMMGVTLPQSGNLSKPVMMRWRPTDIMLSAHRTTVGSQARDLLLPLLHYKFTPGLLRRINSAVSAGGHANNSRGYRALDRVLEAMRERGDTFLAPVSRRMTGFSVLEETGNALGLR